MEEQIQEDRRELRHSFIDLAETTSRVLGVRGPYTQRHEQRVAELAEHAGEFSENNHQKLRSLSTRFRDTP